MIAKAVVLPETCWSRDALTVSVQKCYRLKLVFMGATKVRTEGFVKRQCCRYLRMIDLHFDEYCDQIQVAGLYCEIIV